MQSVNDVSTNNEGLESGNHSYTYDEIGNLTSDKEIEEINWTVYGKIESVVKRDQTKIFYKYDGTGQRIYKKVATTTVTKETHYVRDGSGNVLAIYENKVIDELVIYGSSRLGSYNAKTDQGKRTLGNKKYELSNHLGNVLSVISDNKIGIGSNGVADYYEPLVISESDYYPFGMAMKERSFSNEEYRFGFNGMEKDGDLGEGKTDYGARVLDSKLARWFAVDPLESKYPHTSPYIYCADNPILYIDTDGRENVIYIYMSPAFLKKTNLTVQNRVDMGLEILSLLDIHTGSNVNVKVIFTNDIVMPYELDNSDTYIHFDYLEPDKDHTRKYENDIVETNFIDGTLNKEKIQYAVTTEEFRKNMSNIAVTPPSSEDRIIYDDSSSEPYATCTDQVSSNLRDGIIFNTTNVLSFYDRFNKFNKENDIPIALLGDVLASSIVHEIGHTRGLRHNSGDENEETIFSGGDGSDNGSVAPSNTYRHREKSSAHFKHHLRRKFKSNTPSKDNRKKNADEYKKNNGG